MKLINLICPNCGGGLTVNEKLTKCTCPFCGGEVLVDKENLAEEDIKEIGKATAKAIRAEKQDRLIGEWQFSIEDLMKPEQRRLLRWVIICAVSLILGILFIYIFRYMTIVFTSLVVISVILIKGFINQISNLYPLYVKSVRVTKKYFIVRPWVGKAVTVDVQDIIDFTTDDDGDVSIITAHYKIGLFHNPPEDFLNALKGIIDGDVGETY